MKRPSKKAERAALDELTKHSYLFFRLTPKDERSTTITSFNRKTGRMTFRPAIAIKLVVPETSVLGREIVKLYKTDEKRKARRAR